MATNPNPKGKDLAEFLAEYNPNEEHPVTEINVTQGQGSPRPFIIIRHGRQGL